MIPDDSDQLELELGMPWYGISPRYLTRAPQRLIVRGTGRPDHLRINAAQLTMFLEGTPYGTFTQLHPWGGCDSQE